jgi:ankyrin repeat protein
VYNLKAVLSDAAQEGNQEAVRTFLSFDPSLINSRNEDLQTPLSVAARWGRIGTVEFLLSCTGVNANAIDKYNCTPLIWSINWAGGTPEIVDMLLARPEILVEHRDNHGQNAVTAAAQGGRDAILASLLKRDDVNVNNADDQGFTPLIWAAERGHIACIKQLIERRDLNVNAKTNTGMTAIAWAAYMGHAEIVKILIEKTGADLVTVDSQRKTPIIHARDQGYKV